MIAFSAIGQTDTENYVKKTTYHTKTKDVQTALETGNNLTSNDKIESVTYYDGLGRAKQSIVKQAEETNKIS